MLDPSPVPSVLLPSSLSPSSCAAAVFVVSCRCLSPSPSPSPSLSSTYGGCPPHRLSSSPGPHHCCCCCCLSPCCQCWCRPVLLFLSSWLPFFFVVALWKYGLTHMCNCTPDAVSLDNYSHNHYLAMTCIKMTTSHFALNSLC